MCVVPTKHQQFSAELVFSLWLLAVLSSQIDGNRKNHVAKKQHGLILAIDPEKHVNHCNSGTYNPPYNPALDLALLLL